MFIFLKKSMCLSGFRVWCAIVQKERHQRKFQFAEEKVSISVGFLIDSTIYERFLTYITL